MYELNTIIINLLLNKNSTFILKFVFRDNIRNNFFTFITSLTLSNLHQ